MSGAMPEREAIARLIAPSSWCVMDSELERFARHQPKGGYDPAIFQDRVSLALADEILALIERRRSAQKCVNHGDRAPVTNLDGDDLCQECADAWCRAEGQWAADEEARGQ
jgi:hypothetical protein